LFLDYQYSTTGIKTITARINSVDLATSTVNILSEVNDITFASDQDLIKHRGDILNYVRTGRNSFIDKHRLVKELIVDFVNRRGILKPDKTPYTDADITNIESLKQWAIYRCLSLIMYEMSNQNDDVFYRDYLRYLEISKQHENETLLFLDLNNDGVEDKVRFINTVKVQFT